MTDAEYKALRKKLQALVDKWVTGSGLGTWRIELCWFRDSYKVPGEEDAVGEGAAYCKPDWRYLHAQIGFNLPVLLDMDDGELEYVVVHELMHVFLHELRRPSGGDDAESLHYCAHEERVASMLAKALVWMVNAPRR